MYLGEIQRWEKQYRQAWTEPRPEPLEMSDEEVLNWVNDYADQATWNLGTDLKTGYWEIECDELPKPVRGKTFREAVKLAAAMMEEASQ